MLAAFPFSQSQPVAHAILVLATLSVLGLALGSLKFRGIALGSAGVVFAGILIGHFGARVDHRTLDFVKEFGLVLFVFTIGLHLGPRFGGALREHGLKLNLLAATIVILGAGVAVIGAMLLRIDYAAAMGLFSGATTNTPSLGAAGIAGIIASLLILRSVFRIDPVREAEQLALEQRGNVEPLERLNLVVENARLENLALRELPGCHERLRPTRSSGDGIFFWWGR